ncbi:hypothetical protein OKW41_000580 [Paraburkholderia sp. UCT70]
MQRTTGRVARRKQSGAAKPELMTRHDHDAHALRNALSVNRCSGKHECGNNDKAFAEQGERKFKQTAANN